LGRPVTPLGLTCILKSERMEHQLTQANTYDCNSITVLIEIQKS